jgi:hypothetical protein
MGQMISQPVKIEVHPDECTEVNSSTTETPKDITRKQIQTTNDNPSNEMKSAHVDDLDDARHEHQFQTNLSKALDDESIVEDGHEEDSMPSQTDTEVSPQGDDSSLDSLTNAPPHSLNELQPLETSSPIPAEIGGENASKRSSPSVAQSDIDESVTIEIECMESIEIEAQNDYNIPNDGSVISAIQINDSFCEIGSLRTSIDLRESEDTGQPKQMRPTKVTFHDDLVTETIGVRRWTVEEKGYLFYTGKEMYQFRIEYMVELHDSMEFKNDEWPIFSERGSIRVFWSMYAALLDFFACKAVTQFCCGNSTTPPATDSS